MRLNKLFENDDKFNAFLAQFGVGPDYVPPKPKYKTCSACGNDKARVREHHADTDMGYMAITCPECNHEEEI